MPLHPFEGIRQYFAKPHSGELEKSLASKDLLAGCETRPLPDVDRTYRPFLMAGVRNHEAERIIRHFHQPCNHNERATVAAILLDMVRSDNSQLQKLGYEYIGKCIDHPDCRRNDNYRAQTCALFYAQAYEHLVKVDTYGSTLLNVDKLSDFDLLLLSNNSPDGVHRLPGTNIPDERQKTEHHRKKRPVDKTKPRRRHSDPDLVAKRRERKRKQEITPETQGQIRLRINQVMAKRGLPKTAIDGKSSILDLARFAREKSARLTRLKALPGGYLADTLRSFTGTVGVTRVSEFGQEAYKKQYASCFRQLRTTTPDKSTLKLISNFGTRWSNPNKDLATIGALNAMLRSGNKQLESVACVHLRTILSSKDGSASQQAVATLYSLLCARYKTAYMDGQKADGLHVFSDFELCLLSSAMPTGVILDSKSEEMGINISEEIQNAMSRRLLTSDVDLRKKCLDRKLTVSDLCTLLEQGQKNLSTQISSSPLYPEFDNKEGVPGNELFGCKLNQDLRLVSQKVIRQQTEKYHDAFIAAPIEGHTDFHSTVVRMRRLQKFGEASTPYAKNKGLIRMLMTTIRTGGPEEQARGFRELRLLLENPKTAQRALALLVEDTFEQVHRLRENAMKNQQNLRVWGTLTNEKLETSVLNGLDRFNLFVLNAYARGKPGVVCNTLDDVLQSRMPGKDWAKSDWKIGDIANYCADRSRVNGGVQMGRRPPNLIPMT